MLTPADHQRVLELVAGNLTAHLLGRLDESLDEYITVPLATAAQLLGCSQKTVQRNYPIVHHSERDRGITLAALRAAIAEKTVHPQRIAS